jgi:hypothetical protein
VLKKEEELRRHFKDDGCGKPMGGKQTRQDAEAGTIRQ